MFFSYTPFPRNIFLMFWGLIRFYHQYSVSFSGESEICLIIKFAGESHGNSDTALLLQPTLHLLPARRTRLVLRLLYVFCVYLFVCLSVCPHLSYYVFSVTHRSFRPGIFVCVSLQ